MTTIKIAKTHELVVDDAKFTDDVKAFVYEYGLRQILNDAGSSGKGADEKLAMAQKKLDALYAGTLRAVRGAGSPKAGKDAIEAEMDRMARDAIKSMLAARGHKLGDFEKVKVQYWIDSLKEKHGATWRPQAEAIVAAREGAAGDDILGDLDL